MILPPSAPKVRQAAASAKLTLASVAVRYLDAKQERLRPSTYKQAKWHFETLWAPLGDQPIDTLKRASVAARLQEITKAHGRTSAARARGNLSALFTWAMKEGLCEANPVIATNDPAAGILPRDRVLGDGELTAIWKACADDDFGRIVKLLVLTGCRREEIGGLKWTEIDLDAGILTVPGAHEKSPRPCADVAGSRARHPANRAAPRGPGLRLWQPWRRLRGMVLLEMVDTRIAATEGKPLARWTLTMVMDTAHRLGQARCPATCSRACHQSRQRRNSSGVRQAPIRARNETGIGPVGRASHVPNRRQAEQDRRHAGAGPLMSGQRLTHDQQLVIHLLCGHIIRNKHQVPRTVYLKDGSP